MNYLSLFKTFMFVVSLGLFSSTYANTPKDLLGSQKLIEKDHHSIIERALQQKRNEAIQASNDNDLRMLTTIHGKTATQNFFSMQNKTFSRFVQTFFVSSDS